MRRLPLRPRNNEWAGNKNRIFHGLLLIFFTKRLVLLRNTACIVWTVYMEIGKFHAKLFLCKNKFTKKTVCLLRLFSLRFGELNIMHTIHMCSLTDIIQIWFSTFKFLQKLILHTKRFLNFFFVINKKSVHTVNVFFSRWKFNVKLL